MGGEDQLPTTSHYLPTALFRKVPPPRSGFKNMADYFRHGWAVLVQCDRTLLANLKNNAS